MLCWIIGHRFAYGLVQEPERSEPVHIRKCERCGEYWYLHSCQVNDGKLINPHWNRHGKAPQFTVAPVWFANEAEFIATIQQRED